MPQSPEPSTPPEPMVPDIPDIGPSQDVPVGPPDVGPSPHGVTDTTDDGRPGGSSQLGLTDTPDSSAGQRHEPDTIASVA